MYHVNQTWSSAGQNGRSIVPKGRRFCYAPFLWWRKLSFGQTIYLIIEQQYIHIYISSNAVNEVIATDSQSIAVARNLPDCQFGIGNFRTEATAAARPWIV